MARSWQELKQQLDDGEWLTIGNVAILLGVDRTTVHHMLKPNERTGAPARIRYRVRPGAGAYRECHPADVRRELDARQQIHGEADA